MKLISRMVLQMYAPAALIAGGGLLIAEAISRIDSSVGGITSARVASLTFLLAILLGTSWALHSSWRLYRWALGRELRCDCGGMLSKPRINRNGEVYRKCIGCGSKRYEQRD